MKSTNLSMRATRAACGAALTALALGATPAGAAIVEGTTHDGHRYVVGGIGSDEVDALRGQAPSYSLQVITAARGGAYLAANHVRILRGSETVLDAPMDAPWLLVDLPQGRYTVLVTHGGSTIERPMTIAAGKPQRILLHFDAPVDQEGPTLPTDTSRSRMPQ